MRANAEEMRACARIFAQRLGGSRGNVTVLVAKRGFSMVNREGQVFYDPQADQAFLDELTATMPAHVPVRVLDLHHNDEAFANACVDELLSLMAKKERN